MRLISLALVLAACGSSQPPPINNDDPVAHPKDTRTPLERRRDTACEKVGAKVTQCAFDDAKADLAAGKVTQKQFDQDTAVAVMRKNTEKYIEGCEVPLSSRQVRVLEVCFQSETECNPLLDCLGHLNDKPAP